MSSPPSSSSSGDFAVDYSHGLSTALITTAVAKGYTMVNGMNVDFMVQAEAGVASGASAVVADTLLKDSDPMVKAGASGAILAGVMYAWKQDENFWLWVPIGAGSYYLSDWAMTAWAKAQEKKKGGYGRNGGGRRHQDASDGPTIPGM